jgi:hypothetical protein
MVPRFSGLRGAEMTQIHGSVPGKICHATQWLWFELR